jgi:hypothetical protein
MVLDKSLGLSLQIARELSIKERAHMQNKKTGKLDLLPLWTERNLKFLGRSNMLYLIFVRWTFLFFLLLSITHIPQAYFYFTSKSGDQNIWYRFSIANWQLNENYAVNIAIGCLEIFNLLVVIVYIRILLWWIKRNSKVTEETIVTTGDFSVEVVGVPANTVELKWLDHFTKFFSRFGYVQNVALALDSASIGRIKTGRDYYEKMVRITSLRVERAKRFIWIEKLKLWYYSYMLRSKSTQFKAHTDRISRSIESCKCLGYAYVTFDTELARWQCLNTFNKPLPNRLCGKGVPKYFGKKFTVNKSEEPSNILWENAGHGFCGRSLRRLVGVVVTLFLVIISVALSALLISQRDKFAFSKALLPNGTNASNLAVISTNFIGSALLSICLFVILQVLNWCLYYINFFEKHRYKSAHRKSLMIKTAIGSFLCTLVSFFPFLKVDTEAPPNFTIPWHIPGINNGTGIPTVFTEDSGFYYTLFMCILASCIGGILKESLLGPYHWLLRQYNIYQSLTQEDLNSAYEPPRYSLQYRYSSLLSIISVALAFSGMTPVVLWLKFPSFQYQMVSSAFQSPPSAVSSALYSE